MFECDRSMSRLKDASFVYVQDRSKMADGGLNRVDSGLDTDRCDIVGGMFLNSPEFIGIQKNGKVGKANERKSVTVHAFGESNRRSNEISIPEQYAKNMQLENSKLFKKKPSKEEYSAAFGNDLLIMPRISFGKQPSEHLFPDYDLSVASSRKTDPKSAFLSKTSTKPKTQVEYKDGGLKLGDMGCVGEKECKLI